MRIYESTTWLQDIDRIIAALPELSDLEGSRILITGAGGLICSAAADVLLRYNETHDGKIGVLAAGRNEERILKRFDRYVKESYFQFVLYDSTKEKPVLPEGVDYILHGAGNASPGKIMKEPVETMISNFMGTLRLLQSMGQQNTKRMLYISSSEIYGKKEDNAPYGQEEYGYIDLLKARNSYSVGKRAAETLCISFGEEYGTETVICRPGHIYGPTALPDDNRVSSAWALAAARGEEIVMKSDGAQLRSYCYCLDCASAMFKVLLCGENGHAYNISNPDSIISIRQMAEILADAAGVRLRLELPTREEKRGFNPMSNSSLVSEALQQLSWRGQFNAVEGLGHTVTILRECLSTMELE